MNCVACGAALVRRGARGRHPKYCDMKCRGAARRRADGVPERIRIPDSQCAGCGIQFKPRASAHTKFCSRECFFALKKKRAAERQAERQAERRRPRTIDCATCGHTFVGRNRSARYCGDECRREKARRDSHARTVRRSGPPPSSCIVCGGEIIRPSRGAWRSTCSRACSRRTEAYKSNRRRVKRRRKRILRGADRERYSDEEIFRRDGWRCGLCGKKVSLLHRVPHPKAPTIDHVVPLSDGGSDTRRNVQLAHFLCNSKKGDRAGGQIRLLG